MSTSEEPPSEGQAAPGAEVGGEDRRREEPRAPRSDGPAAGGDEETVAPISFVTRLRRHYGEGVDPEISLQEDAGDPAEETPSRTPSGSSRGLVARLSEQGMGVRYRVRREVARGGMGTILRVWDEDLRRNLAMKVMHGRGVDEEGSSSGVDEEKLGRFLEEAQITGQLDHPGIVPVHDLGIDDAGRCYFTMRLVRGRELKEILDLTREGKEGWTRTRALGLVLKVCESMAFAHSKGVVHRDLKPSNVMVGRFGEVYVMDWGLARILSRGDGPARPVKPSDASSLSLVRSVRMEDSEANPDSPLVTMDGDVVGTPSFMALEQAQGKLDLVGPTSDVYSLGSILYYMLTGRAPYIEPGERVSPHTVLNRVLQGPPEPVTKYAKNEPPELVAICEKAMERDYHERYQSMLEVADDIEAFLENRVVRAYEGGALAEFKKWMARNRGMAAGIAGMVLLSIVSAVGFGLQKSRQVARLNEQIEETDAAKDEAERNLKKAQGSQMEAARNLELARENQKLAEESEALARQNFQAARRSSYMANVLAADFSLELNDVAGARKRLEETDEELRGWEWNHLRLRVSPTLASFDTWPGGTSVSFTPDGETVVSLDQRGIVRFNDAHSLGDAGPTFISVSTFASAGLLTFPLAMDLSSDGQFLVVVGVDETIRIWDLMGDSKQPSRQLPPRGGIGHEARVSAAAYSRDGLHLVTGAVNGSIIVWDSLGEVEARFSSSGPVQCLAWSPDSRRFAAASGDGVVRIWDTVLRGAERELRGHQGAVNCLVWDELGERLFTAGSDSRIRVWDVASGGILEMLTGHSETVNALSFDPLSGRLASCSDDRTVRVWGLEDDTSWSLRSHVTPVTDVAFSGDGARLVSSARDGTVSLWDARRDFAFTDFDFHEAAVDSVAFDPEGKWVLTAAKDYAIVLWDAVTGKPLRRLRGYEREDPESIHTRNVIASFGPDGRWVYAATNAGVGAARRGTVWRWDAETGDMRSRYPHPRDVTAAAATPGGGRLITAMSDKTIRILDAETVEVLRELSGVDPVSFIALHPDGEHFATAARGIIRIWNIRQDKPLRVIRQVGILSMQFHPNGSRLLASTYGGDLLQFDTTSWETVAENVETADRIFAAAYAPDGQRIASGTDKGQVRIHEAETGQVFLTLDWNRGPVTSLAFSPDGSRLLAGSSEGAVRIWETGDVAERRARWLDAHDLAQRVEPMVAELFDEHFLLGDVVSDLQIREGLDDDLRGAAIRLAKLRGDDAELLARRTLDETLPGDRPGEVYARALRRAEAAVGLAPDSARVRLARGASLYRTGRAEEARLLLESEAEPLLQVPAGLGVRTSSERRVEALVLLFLAMAQFDDGRTAQARDSLRVGAARVEEDTQLAYDTTVGGLLEEARALIEGAGI